MVEESSTPRNNIDYQKIIQQVPGLAQNNQDTNKVKHLLDKIEFLENINSELRLEKKKSD